MKGFGSEAALATAGGRALRAVIDGSGAKGIRTRREVAGPGSVPDLVVYRREGERVLYVVTIEFKLHRWRRALAQAFRHRNFGNEAYVVLDEARARGALQHLDEFKSANVGLILMSTEGTVEVITYPEPRLPFSRRFSEAFARALLSPRRSLPRDLPFTRTTRGGVSLGMMRRAVGAPRVVSRES